MERSKEATADYAEKLSGISLFPNAIQGSDEQNSATSQKDHFQLKTDLDGIKLEQQQNDHGGGDQGDLITNNNVSAANWGNGVILGEVCLFVCFSLLTQKRGFITSSSEMASGICK
jgi:hypothetical protein